MAAPPTNQEIARALDEVADLLALQKANVFRIHHWRNAAKVVRHCEVPVSDLVRERAGVPGVGPKLASAIRELVTTGRLRTLERLEGEVDPERLLAEVPGLGRELAHEIHEKLGISTLEELEQASHDGRLASLPRFGSRRVLAVRESLAGMLRREGRGLAFAHDHAAFQPCVETLLSVDEQYRDAVAAGTLPMITPRRFNAKRESWLPILHADRSGHSFTALFSNTARAHELGKTRDWVVLYWDHDGDHDRPEGQCTVVTETRGPLAGRRVVRGRERECADWYAGNANATAS